MCVMKAIKAGKKDGDGNSGKCLRLNHYIEEVNEILTKCKKEV